MASASALARAADWRAQLQLVDVTVAERLVVDLDTRLAAGEQLPTLPPWHAQENKWRAARYGLDAIVILSAAGDETRVPRERGQTRNPAGGTPARPPVFLSKGAR